MDLHKEIIQAANDIKDELVEIRKEIHKNPEIGFELTNTLKIVEKKLSEYGYNTIRCGKAGIVAEVGKGDKCFLLRADMDALPIKEEACIDYKSNNSYMHACGHDMHTVMLLGAAKLLKRYESRLNGRIKLMFQPAEEILAGASDMIDNGVLNDVEEAMMIHVSTGTPFNTGSIFVGPIGISAPAAAHFEIIINGMSSHGGMPEAGINPIAAAVNIIIGMNNIIANELGISNNALISITAINSGNTTNVIPDKAIIKGTIRAYDDKIMNLLRKRVSNLGNDIASAFRCQFKINYISKCPTLINDERLNNIANHCLNRIFNDKLVDIEKIKGKSSGSEDFAYISHLVPSIMLSISAGGLDEGYKYPIHHPKAIFNSDAITTGVVAFVCMALDYFNEK